MEVAMERASWMMGGAEPKMARAQGRRPETARARGRRPRLSSRVTGSPELSVIRLVIFSLLGVAEMSAMTSGVECTSP